MCSSHSQTSSPSLTFPSCEALLPAVLLQIGAMSGVIVLDCSQQHAEDNMEIDSTLMVLLEDYKYTSLPVLSHYDDQGLLTYVSSLP